MYERIPGVSEGFGRQESQKKENNHRRMERIRSGETYKLRSKDCLQILHITSGHKEGARYRQGSDICFDCGLAIEVMHTGQPSLRNLGNIR